MNSAIDRSDSLLLSQPATAKALGVSTRTISHMIASGNLQTVKIGRRVMIQRRYLEALATPGSHLETGNSPVGTPLNAPL